MSCRYLLSPISLLILLLWFQPSMLSAQDVDSTDVLPKGIFVDLQRVQGWGPFQPREGYQDQHYVGTFTLLEKEYTVYLLRRPGKQIEERILFDLTGNELQFTEGKGLWVYSKYETVNLAGADYDIIGYSQKAKQFVLTQKEKVPYAEQGLARKTPASDFEAETITGQKISLTDHRGSYVLLHFWGTWCGPCRIDTPYLVKAHELLGHHIRFIGIAVDNDEEAMQDYVKKQGMNWAQVHVPHVYPAEGIVAAYKVRGYPAYYLIGPEGEVVLGPENQVRLRGERLLETLVWALEQH